MGQQCPYKATGRGEVSRIHSSTLGVKRISQYVVDTGGKIVTSPKCGVPHSAVRRPACLRATVRSDWRGAENQPIPLYRAIESGSLLLHSRVPPQNPIVAYGPPPILRIRIIPPSRGLKILSQRVAEQQSSRITNSRFT